MHGAPFAIADQGEARPPGLDEEQPCIFRHGPAPQVERRHQIGLYRNKPQCPASRKAGPNGADQFRIDGACQARRAARSFAHAQVPSLGALAVELREVKTRERQFLFLARHGAVERDDRVAHEFVGQHHGDVHALAA